MNLETAETRRPEKGAVMLWIGKAKRMRMQPIHRVLICARLSEGNFTTYHVMSQTTQEMHTARATSLVWEESLKQWLSPTTGATHED